VEGRRFDPAPAHEPKPQARHHALACGFIFDWPLTAVVDRSRARQGASRALEDFADDSGSVGLVLGECLARPGPVDLDPAAAEAEVLPVVGFGRAPAQDQPWSGVFGLHAVEQPVRAGLGAG
jgi:hypothetical protein